MPIGNDPQTVSDQYRREDGLTTRASVWRPPDDGVTPQDVAVQELRSAAPDSLLEIGCGTGLLAERVARELSDAQVLATDRSERMVALTAERGIASRVVDADELPFAEAGFDAVLAAWMLYHVPDLDRTLSEVRRVLRPGGRWVFSVNHPMRWIFRDDPGPDGLEAVFPYFDRTPYAEFDTTGTCTYVEHHRTVGDRVREVVRAGLILDDIVEPEWPEWLTQEWGQWSPLRGAVFPGTAIFVSHKPDNR